MCDGGAGVAILISKLHDASFDSALPRIVSQPGVTMPMSELSGQPARTMSAAVLYAPGDLRPGHRRVPAGGDGTCAHRRARPTSGQGHDATCGSLVAVRVTASMTLICDDVRKLNSPRSGAAPDGTRRAQGAP